MVWSVLFGPMVSLNRSKGRFLLKLSNLFPHTSTPLNHCMMEFMSFKSIFLMYFFLFQSIWCISFLNAFLLLVAICISREALCMYRNSQSYGGTTHVWARAFLTNYVLLTQTSPLVHLVLSEPGWTLTQVMIRLNNMKRWLLPCSSETVLPYLHDNLSIMLPNNEEVMELADPRQVWIFYS